jgi:hypothetical protein
MGDFRVSEGASLLVGFFSSVRRGNAVHIRESIPSAGVTFGAIIQE